MSSVTRTDSEIVDPEEVALMLLKHVILLGRNGKPYQSELKQLEVALASAPNAKKYMIEICKQLENAGKK